MAPKKQATAIPSGLFVEKDPLSLTVGQLQATLDKFHALIRAYEAALVPIWSDSAKLTALLGDSASAPGTPLSPALAPAKTTTTAHKKKKDTAVVVPAFVKQLSDNQLVQKFTELGHTSGPVNADTRPFLEIKYVALLQEADYLDSPVSKLDAATAASPAQAAAHTGPPVPAHAASVLPLPKVDATVFIAEPAPTKKVTPARVGPRTASTSSALAFSPPLARKSSAASAKSAASTQKEVSPELHGMSHANGSAPAPTTAFVSIAPASTAPASTPFTPPQARKTYAAAAASAVTAVVAPAGPPSDSGTINQSSSDLGSLVCRLLLLVSAIVAVLFAYQLAVVGEVSLSIPQVTGSASSAMAKNDL